MGLTKSTITNIEAKAYDLLFSAYGNVEALHPPINLAEVLNKLSLTLKVGNFKDSSISGYYDQSTKTIYISEDEPYSRQIFTIAHEIGHYLLHQDKQSDVFYRLDAIQLEKQDKQEEQEANWFAASLIMPKSLVVMYWNVLKDAEKMANLFQVSHLAMSWRLKNLGLLD